MRRYAPCCLFILSVLCTPYSALGADATAEPKYRNIGPYAGGRVCRACGVPGDPLTYYAATASGGVWKSSDGGLNWKPIFDKQSAASIGSIAVAASDPNVIYVGTGEANIRGNVATGAGIFKSEDAGKTWKHVWKQRGQIGTMAIHPKNANIAYAAVLGHVFGPNAERGVYRTKDGGKTWQKVLYKDEHTGCCDVAIDPNNPRIIFTGFWQARRRPWHLTSGGPGSDLYVSRDGGDTWVSLKKDAKKKGLPEGLWGKIGVAIAPSNSQRIYAIIEAEKGGLFRSDDGGETWRRTSESRTLRQRAWYYSTLTVHPTNPDVVFAPNVPLLKSIDGGHTFRHVKGAHHGDHHDLWIDPTNPQRMIDSNDGGVDLSADGGKTWYAPPLPISQFYHVHVDNSVPYRVMGCMQDLGSASGPSNSLKPRGIDLGDWCNIGGGEAGYAVPDPSDPNIIYAGEYGGVLTRYDKHTTQSRNITINQWNPSGIDPAKHKYRFQWTAPILVSWHDPRTVYHAGNVLFRTRDGGQTWQPVSKDLTRNDKQKQQWSGGPITGDNTGAEVYCTIFALGESPKQKGLLWAGTDDGKVWLTRDDCKTWTDVTMNVPDLPDWGTVQCIEASPFDVGTAYLVVDNHRMDDYRPHVWKTTNFGKTWTAIIAGLDTDVHCHAVREDPKKQGQLYLATERGVMYSPNAGKTWKPLQLNLPTVPVHDLVVKGDGLVLGTHGRSIWILDDLTVFREEAKKNEPVHFFSVRPATKWHYGGGNVSSHLRNCTAANPADGAVIWYAFREEPKNKVKLEIRDAKGNVVATAKGKSQEKAKHEEDADDEEEDRPHSGKKERKLDAKAGVNRFIWDLTHDGAETIPGAQVDSGNPGMGIPVSPGTYTVKLTVGDRSRERTVEVTPDPRVESALRTRFEAEVRATMPRGFGYSGPDVNGMANMVREAERKAFEAFAKKDINHLTGLKEQEQLALRLRDDITKLSRTVHRIRALQKQIALRKELLKDNDDAKPLLKDTDALSKKLTALEERLHNPKAKITYDIFAARGGAMLYSQLTFLLGSVTDGDGSPTKSQKEWADELTKRLADDLAAFDKLTKQDVAKLNGAAKKLGVPELYVPPVSKSRDR